MFPCPATTTPTAIADVAVYRPWNGLWIVLLSTTNFSTYITQQWGLTTDVPVPADYDGDGRTDMAVYRPSTGFWYLAVLIQPANVFCVAVGCEHGHPHNARTLAGC